MSWVAQDWRKKPPTHAASVSGFGVSMNLFEEFSSLVGELEKEGIDYALCGGMAMAVYAFPRVAFL